MKAKLSLFCALLLLACLSQPALAARRPSLLCECWTDGAVLLTLEDLDGSGVYAAQLELTLEGEYPGCSFTPDGAGVYSPPCTVSVRLGRTEVTVYLTAGEPLTQDGLLVLGELDLGVEEDAAAALPAAARITLLGRDLQPLEGGMTGSVSVDAVSRSPQPGPAAPSGGGADRTDEPLPVLPISPVLPDGGLQLPFTDVGAGDWFYGEVRYVYTRGMMGGTAAALFSPGGETTRGMIVAILHRLESSPAAPPAAFIDVPASQYYAAPVDWAASCGVVTGVTPALFRPENPVTREQLAAILWRYAAYKGLDVSRRADLGLFPDAAQVSPYAAEAMAWAVDMGLISGADGRLDPGGGATRAQTAVILARLCQNVLVLP